MDKDMERNDWQKYNEATGVPSLSTSLINNITIPPEKKEQEKIADFLTAIDKKLEAVAKQIKLTEKSKKGLLQKCLCKPLKYYQNQLRSDCP